MGSINIVVALPAFDRPAPQADAEILRRIREVSPEITVKDATSLMVAEFQGDNSKKEQLDKILVDTDIIFGLILPKDILARAPKLKWLQMMSAGVDRLRDAEIWKSKITITGVSGIHASPIGEFVMGFILMLAKGMPSCFRRQQKHEWQRYMPHLLCGKTVGIVGLGHIGSEVARLSRAFGMKVIATRRSVKKPGKARNVDLLLPQARMKEMLAESDFVVLALPLTPETRHIIGDAEFRAMKPNALIINIGRGNLIDEAALIRALDEKRITGAGLDVTAAEPLPKESRLWDMDNVIITPHVSGGMEDYIGRAAALFCENLKRYIDGKRLINIIDRKKGY